MTVARARIFLFSFVAAAYAVVFSLSWLRGLAIDYGSVVLLLQTLILPCVALILYTVFRRMEPARVALEAIVCGLLLVVPVGLSTYLAIGMNFPLADAALVRMDAALGLDWRAFVAFVDARPLLASVLGFAYESFSLQLLATPVLLVLLRQDVRAYAMVTAYGALCLLSSLISTLYPALAAYVTYDVAASDLANIDTHFGFAFLEQFNGVRSDPDFVFSLADVAGILTFPSVHVGVAILCSWALWHGGLLRYLFLVLNSLMVASAVSHGGHYFVDVLAGAVVAGLTVGAVNAIFKLGRGTKQTAAAPVTVT